MSWVRVSPPLASPRAARRVIRASWLSRASCKDRARSNGRPTRKWSRRARRVVRSCHRGARLIWNVIRTGKNRSLFGVTPGNLGRCRRSGTPVGSSDWARALSSGWVRSTVRRQSPAMLAVSNGGASPEPPARTIRTCSKVGAASIGVGVSRFGHRAPLLRVIRGWRSRERVAGRSAPSTNRITSGCTRRHRATIVYMQSAANRWRRRQ